ncbi:MAG: hypothetical protein XD91_0259 [Clostridiales bacterium 38_11]|nr:MAG: hypothetical protein XD91_0259 [Clostridiales bacterium 38_11]
MITIELKGQLIWCVDKKKTIPIETFEGNLKDLIILLRLPESEIGMILVNQKKEPLSYCVKDNDHIIIVPVVGGG